MALSGWIGRCRLPATRMVQVQGPQVRGPRACQRSSNSNPKYWKIDFSPFRSPIAPNRTRACTGILESVTVLLISSRELVYSHLQMPYSQHFFQKSQRLDGRPLESTKVFDIQGLFLGAEDEYESIYVYVGMRSLCRNGHARRQ